MKYLGYISVFVSFSNWDSHPTPSKGAVINKLQDARVKVRQCLGRHFAIVIITSWPFFGTNREPCLSTFRNPTSFFNNIRISWFIEVTTDATWILFTRIFLSSSKWNHELGLHDFFIGSHQFDSEDQCSIVFKKLFLNMGQPWPLFVFFLLSHHVESN